MKIWVVLACFLSKISAFDSAAQIPLTEHSLQAWGDKDVLERPHIVSFINGILSEWNTPGGVSVALVQKSESGWKVETKGFGYAKQDMSPMTSDSQFNIASNSKLFTVVSTGLLISNESLSSSLSWETRICDVFPDWQLMDPIATRETTIADAMSHRTGLPRHDLMYGKSDNITSILYRLRDLKPSTGFRQTTQYNNLMYMLLSHLPSLLLPSKISFTRYVKENIFTPLGMNSTTYSYPTAKASENLADGFGRDNLNRSEDFFGKGTPRVLPVLFGSDSEEGSYKAGPGGIFSSANDIAIWLQTLLLEGRHPLTNKSVIPDHVVKKAATGITVITPVASYPELSPVVYGGGQSRSSYRGHELIEHGGSNPGFMSQVSRLPYDNLGIAVFSNDDLYGTAIIEIIKHRLIDEVLGLDPIDWNTRTKTALMTRFNEIQSQRILPPPLHERQPPSVPISALSGRYTNPGYGDLDLQLLSSDSSGDSSKSKRPKRCVELHSLEEPSLAADGLGRNDYMLLAKWDKLLCSHLCFDHFDGDLFNLTLLDVRPIIQVNSVNSTWIANTGEDNLFNAEFTFNAEGKPLGFGIQGNFWGGVTEKQKGKSVKERAEVWFDRVS